MTGSILDYADLILAALNAVVVIVIVLQMRRLDLHLSLPTAALLTFFLLRVAARLIDAPQLASHATGTLEQIVDVLSIALIVYLLTLTRRLVEAIRAQRDLARLRAEEYERARSHYTQVVRHRTMNPITVISGTLGTLRDRPELDEATRRSLCDGALAAALELSEVILEPERRDELEHELDAQPRVDEEAAD